MARTTSQQRRQNGSGSSAPVESFVLVFSWCFFSIFKEWNPILSTKVRRQKIRVCVTREPTIRHFRMAKTVCPSVSIAGRDAVRERRPNILAADIVDDTIRNSTAYFVNEGMVERDDAAAENHPVYGDVRFRG